MLVGYKDGSLHGFSALDGQELWQVANAHRDGVNTLAVSDKLIVTGGMVQVNRGNMAIKLVVTLWFPLLCLSG